MSNIMKQILVLVLVLIVTTNFVLSQTASDYSNYYQKAEQSFQNKDYEISLENFNKALEIVPNHPRILYSIARLHALMGDEKNALSCLNKSVEIGFGFDADSDADFASIKNLPDFQNILGKIGEKKQPINNSTVAFKIGEKDLIPEGMTYDPVEKNFFISSTYKCKIVQVDKNSKDSDFTTEKQDGLRIVLGMKVDAERRILWANSIVNSPVRAGINPEEIGWSGVFKYDLVTGKLI